MLYGQTTADQLRGLLVDKQSPVEVMEAVDQVYGGRDEIPGLPKYKHWARWAYWWSMHTQPDGTFGDPRQLIRNASRQWPTQTDRMRNSNTTWESVGPNQSTYANNGGHCRGNGYGRIDRIAFHPTEANTIFAGAPSGGLWRTIDGGTTWSCLTDVIPDLGVAGVVVDHSDPDNIFILSGSGDDILGFLVDNNGFFNSSDGIFRSRDAGTTWELIFSFPFATTQGFRMKQHPSDPNVILALTSAGIFRTQDGGTTWASVWNAGFRDIEFHPTDHDTIYVSGIASFGYSLNQGTTWATASGLSFCNSRAELAVSADDPDDVWLLAGGLSGGGQYCGIYHSTDAGKNFSQINSSPDIIAEGNPNQDQSNYDLAIAVDPTNEDIVVTGTLSVWRSTDGANAPGNWTNVAPYWEPTGSQQGTLPSNYVHPDIHDLAFNPLDGKLYCAGDGGIYASTDGGVNWTNISQGIVTGQIYNLSGSLINSNKLGIGLQDNGVKLRVSGSSQDFEHIQSGDGYEVLTDPNNSNIVCATINRSCYVYDEYDDNTRNSLTTSGQFFKPLRYKPGNSNIVYYGDSCSLITDFIDGSSTPQTISACASWTIETCVDDDARIYFAGGTNKILNDPNGTFYVSFDGITASDQSTTTGFPTNIQKITDIATVPDECQKVAFSLGGFINGEKVYYSTQSGDGTWQNISYNLPNVPVFSIAIDDNGYFYVGTSIGVFVKSITGTEWAPYFNGLPRVPVSSLWVQESTNHIFAATFGRGVWKADLATGCVGVVNVNTDLTGQLEYQAIQYINSTSWISGGLGTNVTFRAGGHLQLNPGFTVDPGNTFIGEIAGCID